MTQSSKYEESSKDGDLALIAEDGPLIQDAVEGQSDSAQAPLDPLQDQYEEPVLDKGLVLVVEDEPTVREFVQEVLEFDGGFRTHLVENADKAAEYLEEHADEVSLLLTDVRMPGSMDGIGLASLVSDKWPRMPIVVMSGYISPGSKELPHDVRFIAKPWTVSQLLDGIEASIEDAAGRSLSRVASEVI
jgi:DNA-binding NtrC family response regulator